MVCIERLVTRLAVAVGKFRVTVDCVVTSWFRRSSPGMVSAGTGSSLLCSMCLATKCSGLTGRGQYGNGWASLRRMTSVSLLGRSMYLICQCCEVAT